MENPLSQADIDALMRSLLTTTGEDLFQQRAEGVRTYDFRRPGKFTKEMLRTLVMVHETFARLLQGFFAGTLRTRTQITVRSTNQYTYGELTQLLPNPGVIAKIDLAPLPGTALAEMSHNVAYAIVDRVFGGKISDVQPQRGLSEIEMGVIQRVFREMMPSLEEAWRHLTEVSPQLQGMETNPMFLQGSPSEVMASITLGIDIGEHKGHLTLAYPFSALQGVLTRNTAGGWLVEERPRTEQDEEAIRSNLVEADLEVRAYLGRAQIRMRDLADMQPGAVIQLGTRVGSEIAVYVGDQLLLYGKPGVSNQRLAVQVTRLARGRGQGGRGSSR